MTRNTVVIEDWHNMGRDGTNVDSHLLHFPAGQLAALKIASLTVAAISTVAGIIAYCFFFRMRRAFRHDLIILVIGSDTLESMWFLVYPIVELTHGHVPSSSAFCQVSGFFLTVGIEASDVAVLLVAIHTALYIFVGGGGLYPYRKQAYAFFYLFPLLLASLAFVNNPAYTNTGEFCYLAIDPDWTRRALSWIPRYVIFITLFVLYGCIYLYVNVLMARFGATDSGAQASLSPMRPFSTPRRRSVPTPTLPRITYHGLIPSTRSSRSADPGRRRDDCFRRSSGPSAASAPVSSKRPPAVVRRASSRTSQPGYGFSWRLPNFGQDAAISSEHTETLAPTEGSILSAGPQTTVSSENTSSGMATEPPAPDQAHLQSQSRPESLSYADRETANVWHRAVPDRACAGSRGGSILNIRSVLHRGPRSTGSRSSSVFLSPRGLDWSGNRESRENIRRQLRYLFVYPIVYFIVWLVPFLSHVLGSDGSGAPYGLVLVSLVSLCFQGSADALVFTIQEKPWKHVREGSGRQSFWPWQRRNSFDFDGGPGAGRSKEQMRVDSALAKKRRDVERAQRYRERTESHGLQRVGNREWWDHFMLRPYEASDNDDLA